MGKLMEIEQEPMKINRTMVDKSTFIKKYKKQMKRSIQQIDPSITKEEIDQVVDEYLLEQGMSPGVGLDNNYTEEYRETTLLSVLDWTFARKPIMAGNGTFYKNQYEQANPADHMLRGFLGDRKKIKKKMFNVGDVTSRLYKDLDIKQQNKKVGANSYYGGSGAKTSSFYSTWSGPATTLSAQSVISTTENLFEAFLADNYYFLDYDEFCNWIMIVMDQYEEHEDQIDLTILRPVDAETLATRFKHHIIDLKYEEEEMIDNMVSHLPEELRPYLYYKNNMIRFIDDHDFIKDEIDRLFDEVQNLETIEVDKHGNPKDPYWMDQIPKAYRKEYGTGLKPAKDWNAFVNHKMFIDPNNPPEEIKESLQKLTDTMMTYVYVQYMAFDRIYRLKNFKRDVVTVIDTDSNILSLDTLMRYIIATFFPDGKSVNEYGRSYKSNVYVGINMITYWITTAVADILDSYGIHSNIPEEHRSRYAMKNEFMFGLLVIGETKKRYLSSILLREGNVIYPPKTDIKGFDFKKATCSEYAEKVFTRIIKVHALMSEEIELADIIGEIYAFRDEIIQSIESLDNRFLPNGNAKELAGYADPSRQASVRAVAAWNLINPDNLIELPSKVGMLKMNIFKPEDILPLSKTHPEIYQRIYEGIFNDDTGMFVTKQWVAEGVTYIRDSKTQKSKEWWKMIPKEYQSKFKDKSYKVWNKWVKEKYDGEISDDGHFEYKSKGMTVLAIPSNQKIPEWAVPYIDMTTMVNNILAPFIPVLKIFKFKSLEEGKTRGSVNRKTEGISRIVKF